MNNNYKIEEEIKNELRGLFYKISYISCVNGPSTVRIVSNDCVCNVLRMCELVLTYLIPAT